MAHKGNHICLHRFSFIYAVNDLWEDAYTCPIYAVNRTTESANLRYGMSAYIGFCCSYSGLTDFIDTIPRLLYTKPTSQCSEESEYHSLDDSHSLVIRHRSVKHGNMVCSDRLRDCTLPFCNSALQQSPHNLLKLHPLDRLQDIFRSQHIYHDQFLLCDLWWPALRVHRFCRRLHNLYMLRLRHLVFLRNAAPFFLLSSHIPYRYF